MADDDTNWRNPRRVALNVAVFYTGSYFTVDDRGTVAKAVDTLDRYNIELRVWPEGGRRGSGNMLYDIKAPIPHEKSAYEELRRRVNQMLRGCPFSVVMPAVFTQFDHAGYGITPEWFKLVTPGCLIGPTGNDDKMDLVHEIGHGATCDHVHGDGNRENFMHEANGRSTIYRWQVEKLARASFAVG